MKIEYARVYDRFKNTTCFKDFPSPTRTEFSKKIGEKFSFKRRKLKDENYIDNEKFNANVNAKDVYVENYENSLFAFKPMNRTTKEFI